MFLATTGLTELWDKDDEILLTGPWCLRYDRKAEWENLRYTILPNPWKEHRAIQNAEIYCEKVIDPLVVDLAFLLNQIHGAKFSERYWRILLGGWLIFYVHALYDRYVSTKRALEFNRDLRTVALHPSIYRTPMDVTDFIRLAYEESSDLFNLQLYSQLLKASGLSGVILKEASPSTERRDMEDVPGSEVKTVWTPKHLAKIMIGRMTKALTRVIPPRVMLGGLDFNYRLLARSMAFQGLVLPCPQVAPGPMEQCDKAMRKNFSGIPAKDEFTSVLIQTLSFNFPTLYLEGYNDFREVCLKRWPRPPRVLITSADWYFNEPFKFLAAEFREGGSRLVGVQHGGGYGTSKVIPQEKFELSITDRWLSSGWDDGQRNGKIRALPHPKYLPLKVRNGCRGQSSKSILLVTTSHPRYPFRFESQPVGQFDALLEWRSRFIQMLPDIHRTHLVVRLHNEDYEWDQKRRLVDTCGPLCFDDSGRALRHTFGQSRLVVIEYCGTAYLEALAANVPSVLFWDPQCWEVRDEAAPYFESLRKMGILWDSPEAAAAKVSEVYDHPWAWWGNEGVQEVRRTFVNRYALGREDWVDCWVKFLKEEMALSQVEAKRQRFI